LIDVARPVAHAPAPEARRSDIRAAADADPAELNPARIVMAW
jgi:hypothetical protein